jgi:hypothetical protein
VLNPVRARIVVTSVIDWTWSSYLATAGEVLASTWLNIDWILSIFGDCKLSSMSRYQKFVSEAFLDYSPWEELKQQIYLGSDQFIAKAQSGINPLQDFDAIPSLQYSSKALPISDYENRSTSRDDAIKLAYASGSYSMKELGHYFGLHYSRVSRIINSKLLV